jgi:hypothetical protein
MAVAVLCGCSSSHRAVVRSTTTPLVDRPLHLPSATGTRCPATAGKYVTTPDFGSWSLGNGRVRVAINNAGDLRHGKVRMAAGGAAGWYGIKTHFFSVPGYQGPFLVRARRLDGPGPIRLGGSPAETGPLLVPSGPTANGSSGWREVPYFTFVKAPGCYGWQIDGRMFSEAIVARVLPPLQT